MSSSNKLVRTVALIATAGCAGVGVVFVLLVFLYKPDNVEEIETVLAEHQRPKEIDTNEIKNLFKKELPDFDFSLTTTTTTTTTATTTTTITTTTSILDLITELGIPRTRNITTREPLLYKIQNETTTAYVYKGPTRRVATTTPPYSGPNKTVLMSTLEIRHGNILYATGTTTGAQTEILDLSLETSRHTINFPLNIAGATGDILCGHPTICGGVLVSPNVSVSDECYTLQHSDNGTQPLNFTKTAKMLEPRAFAASIALDNSILWVTGGSGNNSTEWIDTREGNVSYGQYGYGPDLPMILQGHCLIKLDSDTVLLVGGSNEAGLPSHYSWSYNFINGTWTLGPPLWESRYGHFCGKFKAYQNNRTFAVVAGGQSVALTKEEQDQYNGQALPLSSVEILDISDGSSSKNWTTGLSLPKGMMLGGTMVSLPNTVIITYNRSLYALYYPDDTVEGLADILQWQWIELDLHTNINRLHGIAMYYKPDMEYGCCMSTEKEINKHNITAF